MFDYHSMTIQFIHSLSNMSKYIMHSVITSGYNNSNNGTGSKSEN